MTDGRRLITPSENHIISNLKWIEMSSSTQTWSVLRRNNSGSMIPLSVHGGSRKVHQQKLAPEKEARHLPYLGFLLHDLSETKASPYSLLPTHSRSLQMPSATPPSVPPLHHVLWDATYRIPSCSQHFSFSHSFPTFLCHNLPSLLSHGHCLSYSFHRAPTSLAVIADH